MSPLSKKIKFRLTVWAAGWLGRLVYFTNRWHVEGERHYRQILAAGQSVIVAVWHGRLLAPFFYLSGNDYYGLAGTHRDAELITRIGEKIGWKVIRGSSTARGREAYQNILRTLRQPGTLLYITPDGPKGPARVVKPGAIRAALTTGVPIVPCASHSTRFRGFTNWDTFVVAKAFARTEILFGPPLYFTPDMSFEDCANRLTQTMNELERQVDEHTGN